jgi:hypothetical protein
MQISFSRPTISKWLAIFSLLAIIAGGIFPSCDDDFDDRESQHASLYHQTQMHNN